MADLHDNPLLDGLAPILLDPDWKTFDCDVAADIFSWVDLAIGALTDGLPMICVFPLNIEYGDVGLKVPPFCMENNNFLIGSWLLNIQGDTG
jgi:hypothetical protein